mgnify:CR=1 FL=1
MKNLAPHGSLDIRCENLMKSKTDYMTKICVSC